MAGRKPLALSARQFEVLSLLWEHGPMTVRELLGRLPGGAAVPYTTVLGMLQSMERAGFVQRFFRGSAERLVLSLVDTRQLSPEDLRQIEAQLEQPRPAPPPNPKSRGRRT